MSIRFSAPRLRVSLGQDGRRFDLVADGFAIAAGEMVAVTGNSGSGKTLLLEVLGLVRRPDSGSSYEIAGLETPVSLDAAWEDLDGPDRLARFRREIFGFVPQSGGLLNFLDVGRNITLAQQLCGRRDPDYVDHLIGRLDLRDQRRHLPDTLSIGERQRVAIARALAHRPLIVIADEPTASLDPPLSREVISLFLDLATEQKTAVVVSTHDIALVTALGLRRLRLAAQASVPEPGAGFPAAVDDDGAGHPQTSVISRLVSTDIGPGGYAA